MRKFEADGETWEASVDLQAAHTGAAAVVFHCVSDNQRPYRVSELPEHDAADVEGWSGRDLVDLFNASHTMDYTENAAAQPETHGNADPLM